MKKIVCTFALWVSMNLSAHAVVFNGDFSADLTAWTTEGDVQVIAEEAVLGDDGVFYSALLQGVALANGSYTLDFDFLNELSSDVPSGPFGFPDTVFTSLYFIDDLSQFDLLNGVFDDSLALFDLDYAGPIIYDGTASVSSKGGDWLHYSLTFQNIHQYAIPTFELTEFNFVDADSRMLIDNVTIAAATIPEPGTWLLLLAGLLGLQHFKKTSRGSCVRWE